MRFYHERKKRGECRPSQILANNQINTEEFTLKFPEQGKVKKTIQQNQSFVSHNAQ